MIGEADGHERQEHRNIEKKSDAVRLSTLPSSVSKKPIASVRRKTEQEEIERDADVTILREKQRMVVVIMDDGSRRRRIDSQ